MELVKLALEYKPDLIVTDGDMPFMTGIEAVLEIKRHIPAQKALLVTAGTGAGFPGPITKKQGDLADVVDAVRALMLE